MTEVTPLRKAEQSPLPITPEAAEILYCSIKAQQYVAEYTRDVFVDSSQEDISTITTGLLPFEAVTRIAQRKTHHKSKPEVREDVMRLYFLENEGNNSDSLHVMRSFGMSPEDSENLNENIDRFYTQYYPLQAASLVTFSENFIRYCGKENGRIDHNTLERRLATAEIFTIFGNQEVQALVKNLIRSQAVILSRNNAVPLQEVAQSIDTSVGNHDNALNSLEHEQIQIAFERQALSLEEKVFYEPKERDPQKALDKIHRLRSLLEERREQSINRKEKNLEEILASGDSERIIQYGNLLYAPDGGEVVGLTDSHGSRDTAVKVLRDKRVLEKLLKGQHIIGVFAGDLLDRGLNQVELIEGFIELSTMFPDHIFGIQADHEMIDALTHDFSRAVFDAYIAQIDPQMKEAFIRNISSGDLEKRKKQLGIPIEAEDINGIPVSEIIQFVQTTVIHTARGEELPEYPDSADNIEKKRQIQSYVDKIKMQYGRLIGPKVEGKMVKLYEEYFKLFDLLPKVITLRSGLVIVHGGPTAQQMDIQEYRGNPAAALETTWADVETEDIQEEQLVGDLEKEALLNNLEALLAANKALSPTDNITYTYTPLGEESSTRERIFAKQEIEQAVEILKSSQDTVFNAGRWTEPSQLSAVLKHAIVYGRKEIIRCLEGVLGKNLVAQGIGVLLRGHQVHHTRNLDEYIMYDGKLGWVHTTGTGAPDNGVPGEPAYFYFPDTSKPITEVTEENIVFIEWYSRQQRKTA